MAVNVAVSFPVWPAVASTTCGAALAAGAAAASASAAASAAASDGPQPCGGGTAPLPGVLSVSADNASSVVTNVVILTYGCIHQGGYVFALDDTPPPTASVGGKVAATFDQASPYPDGVVWSANGSGAYDGGRAIYGTASVSTPSSPSPSSGQVPGQSPCHGALDGACNTANVFAYYQNYATGAPIGPSSYAAGRCKQTISGYSDWYLPAICELGYGVAGGDFAVCGTASIPTTQNMQSSSWMA